MLNVGLIGLGIMGKNHLRVLHQLHIAKKIKLRLICDTRNFDDLEIDETYQDIYFTGNYDYMLENADQFDLVVICTSTTSHYKICKDFLKAKVNVMVEKPICLDVEESLDLSVLARANNLKLFVGHIERFNPCVTKIKSLLSQIGSIKSFNFTRIGMARQSFNTGILLDLAIHDFDLVNILIGSEYQLDTICTRNNEGVDVASISTLKYKNGILGTIQNSYDTTYKLRTIQINGHKGNIHADLVDSRVFLNTPEYKSEYIIPNKEPLREELLYMINAVENDIDISDDLLRSIEALLKINLAMDGGDSLDTIC